MIVLGADMHKRSHTIAAVGASSGELLGDRTISVGDRGFAAALDWARGLEDELGVIRIIGSHTSLERDELDRQPITRQAESLPQPPL